MTRRCTLLLLLTLALFPLPAFGQYVTVTGVVTDGQDPIADAIVCGMDWDAAGRIAMPTSECAVTDATGAFEIATTLVSDGVSNFGQVVAGAEGYRSVDEMVAEDETADVTLAVDPLTEPDNPDYEWWRPEGDAVQLGCGTCHTTIVEQWSEGRHALAAQDPLVMDMYDGTNAAGDPGVAPGYKLEHDDAGECGACHAATASWSAGETVDMNEIPTEHQWGVYCESCHKIRDVTPGAGPGTEGSITYWRPSWTSGGGYAQFAFGPYPNVISHAMLTSYSPLQRRADLCAGCHQYTNRQGVTVMDTFTDWQAVGDPETTVPCQGCHMKDIFGIKPGEDPMEWLVDGDHMRQMAAQRRDPADVSRHEIWGGIEYASHALDLLMSVDQDGGEVVVRTTTTNVGANHRVPTGMPLREMILVVSAVDASGAALPLLDGPLVGPRGGDIAAEPGRMFAKSLGDAAGELTFAFWDATQLLEDTRLATGESDESEFRFQAPASGGSVDVTARLVYRRASQSLADAKGWDMGEQEIGRKEDSLQLEATGTPDAGPDDGGVTDGGGGGDFDEGCACRTLPAPAGRGATPALLALSLLGALALRRRARPSRQVHRPGRPHP